MAGSTSTHDSPQVIRILIAEDSPTNQKVLEKLLSTIEAHLEFANDGVEAVDAFKRADFDIVLMDVHMPNLDGLDATRQIRAWEVAESKVRVPIIAVTADVMDDKVEQQFAAGIDYHVPKPIDVALLLNTISEALGQTSQA